MEECAEHSEIRSSVYSVSEVFLDLNSENAVHVEVDGLLDGGDITAQEKNKKKKKKYKGGLPSPRRILAFNTSELSKLDEHKAEEKKCAKSFSKSSSFPSNAVPKDNIPLVEGSGDTEDCREYTMSSSPVEEISVLTRATSFPLKSALRGGYEELGIGPRPKLQVKWAPSVWEPPCTTISHTVNKSRSKKDPKHGKKGKSSHDHPHKRQDKKKHHKSKGHSGSSIVRSNGAYYIDGGKEAANPLQAGMSGGNKTSGSVMALPELESKETDASGDAPGVQLDFSLEMDAVGGVHTCGQSLFEPERLACNFLYRQAM